MLNFKEKRIPKVFLDHVDASTLETIKKITSENKALTKKLDELFHAKIQSDCLELIKTYSLKDNTDAYKCFRVIKDQILILVELMKTAIEEKYTFFDFKAFTPSPTYSEVTDEEFKKKADATIAAYNSALNKTYKFYEFIEKFNEFEHDYMVTDENINYELEILRHNNKVLQMLLDKNDKLADVDYFFAKDIYDAACNKTSPIKELKEYPDYMDKLVSDITFGNNKGQRSSNPLFKSTIVGNSIF